MNILKSLFGRTAPRDAMVPLYRAVVAEARSPHWYAEGGVPDTIDGRFDMVSTVLALVLLRLETEGQTGRAEAALLTEVFVDDMDGQLRQDGIGDIVVGKHVGRMMSMLGGRLSAFRDALDGDGDLPEAVSRNLHRGAATPPEALAAAVAGVRTLAATLRATPYAALRAGRIGA